MFPKGLKPLFGYFSKTYGRVGFEILWKLEEVKRVKKSKAYYDELIVLKNYKPNRFAIDKLF
jgi:hypothetical protein